MKLKILEIGWELSSSYPRYEAFNPFWKKKVFLIVNSFWDGRWKKRSLKGNQMCKLRLQSLKLRINQKKNSQGLKSLRGCHVDWKGLFRSSLHASYLFGRGGHWDRWTRWDRWNPCGRCCWLEEFPQSAVFSIRSCTRRISLPRALSMSIVSSE